MQIGVSFLPWATDAMVDKARLVEDLGFDFLGVADSQCISRELYTTMGALARATNDVPFGPWVTNPVTRHPAVTASGMATAYEASDGRAVLGIAGGDSAVFTLGERPAKLAEMERAIETCRALWRGGSVEWNGEDVTLRWVDEDDPIPVPIYLAAEGPKTMRLAGRVADGAVIGLGTSPEVVEGSIEYVNEGAREAGRDPEDVEKWFLAQTNVADDVEEAVDEIKMALGAMAHHSLQFTMEGKFVPDEYREPLREIVENYNPQEHEEFGETGNRQLVERVDITGYLAERYAVVGTPEDCVAQLQSIRGAGADGIVLPAHTESNRNLVERLGTEVLPEVR